MNPVWYFLNGVPTRKLFAVDGTQSGPGVAWASRTGSGWYQRLPGYWTLADGAVDGFEFQGTTSFWLKTDSVGAGIFFGSGADVLLGRAAANRLQLATGDVFNLAPTAFASLPTGAEGDLAFVTDSNNATPGGTVAGGGANNILAFHNGTNWIVA